MFYILDLDGSNLNIEVVEIGKLFIRTEARLITIVLSLIPTKIRSRSARLFQVSLYTYDKRFVSTYTKLMYII